MAAADCEALAKQHIAFLSLAQSPAFETAFAKIVTDHYNTVMKQTPAAAGDAAAPPPAADGVEGDREREREEGTPAAATRSGGKAAKREEPEPEVQPLSSQKPRRTPKPTAAVLAAEEEKAIRRAAAASSQAATPKSAKKTGTKPPPSPPADWAAGTGSSSARKRSRKLFEDKDDGVGGGPDLPRYRSPVVDRWRGRHNTDVDEGVDALLSLASGAHPSAAPLDEGHHVPGGLEAGSTADPDLDGGGGRHHPHAHGDLHDHLAGMAGLGGLGAQGGTPRRGGAGAGAGAGGGRAGRGGAGRATPTATPTGTPVKGGGRGAAAADMLPVAAAATGLRSPRARGGAGGVGSPLAGSRGGGSLVPGSASKRHLMSPARGGGGSALAAMGVALGEAEPPEEEAQSPEDDGGVGSDDGAGGGGASQEAHGMVSASGRPVRRRKPTAIALAAAAAAEEEDGFGRGGRGSVVAAVAAAVAAAGATHAETAAGLLAAPVPMPDAMGLPMFGDGGGGGGGSVSGMMNGHDLLSTEALLAKVPPVRTRGPARGGSGGPGSRRAAERVSPAPAFAGGMEDGGADGTEGGDGDGTEDGMGSQEPQEGLGGGARPGRTTSGAAAAAAQQATLEEQGAAALQQQALAEALAAQRPSKPLPVRSRRRKSLPEKAPPFWEPANVLPVLPRGPGAEAGAALAAPAADAGEAPPEDAAAAGPSSTTTAAAAAGGPPALELALRHSLNTRVRRWAAYEFHYSALDRPWFMRNELMEFCQHMQLPTNRLSRLEWSVLRSALGRPRRLSAAFLREERLRLEGYRSHARVKYEEVGMGLELPAELPRPLRVGQEVAARHPTSRQVHEGVILTAKHNKYKVSFLRSELGADVVRDTDVMPLDPHDCLPLALAPPHPALLNGRPHDPLRLAAARAAAGMGGGGLLGGAGGPLGLLGGLGSPTMGGGGGGGSARALAGQAAGAPLGRPLGSWTPGLDNQLMREQEAAMVTEVQQALEVKEGLVARLAQLNNEAAAGMHTDDGGGRTEHFQLQYTSVVLQLKETNAVLEAALSRLQARQQQVAGANSAGVVLALQQQQQQQQQQQAVAAGLRTAAAAAAVAAAQPQHVAAPAALLQQQQQQSQQQSDGGMDGMKAAGAQQLQLQHEQGVPVVVPPPRSSAGAGGNGAPASTPSAAAAAAGGGGASAFTLPAQLGPLSMLLAGTLMTPEQVVEAAMEEARAVVESCRGSGGSKAAGAGAAAAEPSTAGGGGGAGTALAGSGTVPLVLAPAGAQPTPAAAVEAGSDQQVKREEAGGATPPHTTDGGSLPAQESQPAPAQPAPPGAEPGSELALQQQLQPAGGGADAAEAWLRDVITGCVGVLFTVQRCTSGAVPAGAAAEALDQAAAALRLHSGGDAHNEALLRQVVASVQGLKGHLARAMSS
ncbi:hypothetical protein HXX76_002176 [Chlamydomonas incerta]|uniref:DIRP domain-containing protein n=1 Tax=Chlamydomonas incerta TaxID=51695 RepID=A0A835WAK7_CHLIN|nr:hypothetical protein HXX76_002176 [Chlamydomonas incerta]|eukprot:KAG2443833.1 hypothetical protein HXX76_002176 [Chlamydomonas incerta]